MNGLPDHVATFIAGNIASVEALEVLLLVMRERPKALRAREVAAELRTAEASVAARFADFAERGLLRHEDGAYAYAASDAEHAVVLELEHAYAERRVSVITAIYAPPPAPSDPMRHFADAFRLRDDKDKK